MSNYYIGDIPFDSDYLEHFGILGQKWGVRRFQNPDGTYTSEGLARRYGDTGGDDRAGASRFRKAMSNAKASAKEKFRSTFKPTDEEKAERAQKKEESRETKEAAEKERVLKSGSADEVLKMSAKLTPNELQNAVNRLRNEDALRQLSEASKARKGEKHKRVTFLECMTAADNFLSKFVSIKGNLDKMQEAKEKKEAKENYERIHKAEQKYAQRAIKEFSNKQNEKFEETGKHWFPSAEDISDLNKQIAAYHMLVEAADGRFNGGGKKK